jgi:hypothetical protein
VIGSSRACGKCFTWAQLAIPCPASYLLLTMNAILTYYIFDV